MVRILLQKSTENKAEKMAQITEKVDVCVIGAGHAGCEAALACARMGLETVIFTVSIESIALMPCNPNIGGSSKGHLVRELDALGGEMGKNIDHTFIQSKMLNASKGPAVHSLRAQADKAEYSRRMRQILENQEHLVLYTKEYLKSHPNINFFIYGHRHIELDLMLSVTSRVLILGDWINFFSYAVFDGENLFLEEYIEGETQV